MVFASYARRDLEKFDFGGSSSDSVQVELHHLGHLLVLDLTSAQLVQAVRRLSFTSRLTSHVPELDRHILLEAT